MSSGKAFFSYSRADSEFVIRLASDLRSKGAAVWLDQLDIQPGQRWDSAVEDALKDSLRLLLILSPTAVQSTNVMDEVSFALEEQKEVIPILFSDCKIPFRLRRLQYIDFRGNYDGGRSRLLKILAPEPEAAARQSEPESAELAGDFRRNAGLEEQDQSVVEARRKPEEREREREAAEAQRAASRSKEQIGLEGEFQEKFTETFGAPTPASAAPLQPRSRWRYAAALLMAVLVLAGTFVGARWLGQGRGNGSETLPSESPADPRILKDADSAFDARNYRKAVELYDRWIGQNPLNPSASAYLKRGQAHQALGQLEDAEIDFTNAMGLDPSNAAYFVSRALVRYDQRKLPEARADIVEAIKLNPAIKLSPEIMSRPALADVAVQARAGERPMVMGYVAFDAQKAELTHALQTLKTRGYDPSPRIETVGERAPARSELRYFRADWAVEATKLTDLLKSKGILVEPVLEKGKAADHFEVWLAARQERPANAREIYYEAK